jgi:hypothetical protein
LHLDERLIAGGPCRLICTSQAISAARDEMLRLTHRAAAPWSIVRADAKHVARLNVIRDLSARAPYGGRSTKLAPPDPAILFTYSETARALLAP